MLAPSMSLSPVFWVALSDPARSISDSLANFLNRIVCEETCEQEQIWGGDQTLTLVDTEAVLVCCRTLTCRTAWDREEVAFM